MLEADKPVWYMSDAYVYVQELLTLIVVWVGDGFTFLALWLLYVVIC